jgi:hypothetical protein
MFNRADCSQGRISFRTSGLLELKSQDWFVPALRDSRVELRMRVKPLFAEQFGPARIFTISHNTWNRNLTIGQDGQDLEVRLRTPFTNWNGIPARRVKGVFHDAEWREIDLRIADDRLTVLVDGNTAVDEALPQDPLTSWDGTCRTAVGNELSWDRPWLGEIDILQTRVGGQDRDLIGTDLWNRPNWLVPEGRFKAAFWGPYLAASPAYLRDAAVNLLCFIPLGFVLASIDWPSRPLLWASSLSIGISLMMELGQICIDGRYPSFIDFALNSLGGLLGALGAGLLNSGSVVDRICE